MLKKAIPEKRAPSRKASAKHRVPNHATQLWLLRLIGRINGSARLTADDRRMAAMLLRKIANDEDARNLFWHSVANAPKNADPRRMDAAYLYWVRIEFNESKPGKKLRGEVAKLTGLTDSQVDHAVREFRQLVEADIKAMGRDHMAIAVNSIASRYTRREK